MSSDYGRTTASILLIASTTLLRQILLDSMLCLPKRKSSGFTICLFSLPVFLVLPLRLLVRRFSFFPGVDVDARLRLKQPPRQYSTRAQDRHDLEALSAYGC